MRGALVVALALLMTAASGCLSGDSGGGTTKSGDSDGANGGAGDGNASAGDGGGQGGANASEGSNIKPVAAFVVKLDETQVGFANETGVSEATVSVGVNLTFDASSSSDPDGSIVSYSWSFGTDQGTANTSVATYAYAEAGVFEVNLVVIDNQSAKSGRSLNINVSAAPPAPAYYFFDDADANAKTWTFTKAIVIAPVGSTGSTTLSGQGHPLGQGWHKTTKDKHEGAHSYTMQTEASNGYRDNELMTMVSPTIKLKEMGAVAPVLTFWIKGDAEANNFDGVYWDTSSNGGSTWTTGGKSASSSSAAYAKWTEITYKIPAANIVDNFKVRFLFKSDISCSADSPLPAGCGAGAYTGYFIDEIMIAEPAAV
jgi:hypothetical protein